MTRDLEEEEVDRQKLVVQHTHGLMEALGKTIASDQPAAVVGCARELNSLLGLAASSRQLPNNRGLAKYDLRDYKSAIQDFSRIIEMNEYATDAYTRCVESQ